MARVLKFSYGLEEVDILKGDLRAEFGSLSFKSTRGAIWETIEIISDKNAELVRTAQIAFDEMVERAEAWDPTSPRYNPLEKTPVWLYWQSEGEAAKRALVLGGESEIRSSRIASPLLRKPASRARWSVKHLPWENEDATAIATQANVDNVGGSCTPGEAAGTMDQRIAELILDTPDVTALQQIWVGIRPIYEGTAGFVASWGAADFSEMVDTNLSGDHMVTDFGTTPEMAARMNVQIQDVAAGNFDHFVGRYRVLMRCLVDAETTEIYAELRSGWGARGEVAGSQYITGEEFYPQIKLVDMGEILIPPTGWREGGPDAADLGNFGLELWMERISEAGSINTYRFLLIPAEHMIYIDTTNAYGMGNSLPIRVITTPAGEIYALNEMVTGNVRVRVDDLDWSYPMGGGLLVLAGQTYTASVTGKDVDIDMDLVPRWKTFRDGSDVSV